MFGFGKVEKAKQLVEKISRTGEFKDNGDGTVTLTVRLRPNEAEAIRTVSLDPL